jgi:hypothetical protein
MFYNMNVCICLWYLWLCESDFSLVANPLTIKKREDGKMGACSQQFLVWHGHHSYDGHVYYILVGWGLAPNNLMRPASRPPTYFTNTIRSIRRVGRRSGIRMK